jgi:hypothetical protein
VNAITLRFLISLTITKNIQIRLMKVVTAYLYGSLDDDIYMRVSEAFKSKPRKMYYIKLKRFLYVLK